MTVYLDCNATTPVDARVADQVLHFMTEEFGNSGSRTHDYGLRAKKAVQVARDQVASVVGASPHEVVFTSGATESNNLAILGLAASASAAGRRHIVSTQIEHKAVLEPIAVLERQGFDVTLVPPTTGGWVEADDIAQAVRDDTFLVSMIQVNNETGVVQPVEEVARLLGGRDPFFHVDAAQGFGKELGSLRDPRVDLISISGHKLFAPNGVGALVVRRRGTARPPLAPLFHGGGQERGLRPGTLPVPLAVGLGLAAELAVLEWAERKGKCLEYRREVLAAFAPLQPTLIGDQDRVLPHVMSLSFPGLDSEAAMVALKGVLAVSNGSACTSQSYEPSHVLKAMGLPDTVVGGALRLSWSHMSRSPDWTDVVERLSRVLS